MAPDAGSRPAKNTSPSLAIATGAALGLVLGAATTTSFFSSFLKQPACVERELHAMRAALDMQKQVIDLRAELHELKQRLSVEGGDAHMERAPARANRALVQSYGNKLQLTPTKITAMGSLALETSEHIADVDEMAALIWSAPILVTNGEYLGGADGNGLYVRDGDTHRTGTYGGPKWTCMNCTSECFIDWESSTWGWGINCIGTSDGGPHHRFYTGLTGCGVKVLPWDCDAWLERDGYGTKAAAVAHAMVDGSMAQVQRINTLASGIGILQDTTGSLKTSVKALDWNASISVTGGAYLGGSEGNGVYIRDGDTHRGGSYSGAKWTCSGCGLGCFIDWESSSWGWGINCIGRSDGGHHHRFFTGPSCGVDTPPYECPVWQVRSGYGTTAANVSKGADAALILSVPISVRGGEYLGGAAGNGVYVRDGDTHRTGSYRGPKWTCVTCSTSCFIDWESSSWGWGINCIGTSDGGHHHRFYTGPSCGVDTPPFACPTWHVRSSYGTTAATLTAGSG